MFPMRYNIFDEGEQASGPRKIWAYHEHASADSEPIDFTNEDGRAGMPKHLGQRSSRNCL
jgi:hypothetical protein